MSGNRLRESLAQGVARVPAAWQRVIAPHLDAVAAFVDARVADGACVYPAQVFRALEIVAPADVRVVILGQDPYHGPDQAHGLAFSVNPGVRTPPSLRNILAEVQADTGAPSACAGNDLSGWAAQGVLLLNTALTVEDGQPNAHARVWQALTDAVIEAVSDGPRPVVFLLWGMPAQRKAALIDTTRHVVLAANHPSPLSARRPPVPFLGCRHFTRTNEALARLRPGEPPIQW